MHNKEVSFYSDTASPDEFAKTLHKREFNPERKQHVYQDQTQVLLRNFISRPTIYESMLLYHSLGQGKTCSAISIAEGFKEYINNMGRKIVVLVKNKNIYRNFMNELVSKCTNDDYINEAERSVYYGTNLRNTETKKEVIRKVHKHINKYYSFLTYGSFVNRVLGTKEFVKDELGRNTTKVKRENGEIKRKRVKNSIDNFNNSVVIVDEAHNITNNDVYIALYKVLSTSFNTRLVLLTATPMYDNPKEIFELSNLLNVNNPELQLPIRNDAFKPVVTGPFEGKVLLQRSNSNFINNNILKGGVVELTGDGSLVLKRALLGKVSYMKSNLATFPETIEMGQDLINNRKGTLKVVYCQMSSYQYSTYLQALKLDLRSYTKYDMSTAIQNLDAQENSFEQVSVAKSSSLYKNSSDASTIVYPNGLYGKDGFVSVFEKIKGRYKLRDDGFMNDLKKYSAKLYKLLENIKKSPGPVFIYSNYVSYGGTSLLRLVLRHHGYKDYSANGERNAFMMFDESSDADTRERNRRVFNSPENKNGDLIKIIVGSPIISEGITLKNVRQVHILEPSWNMSRINQIVGRAIRNLSHADLDENERNVRVYKYVSVYYKPKGELEETTTKVSQFFIDREKYILSEEKDRMNKVVERLLKRTSFDCNFLKIYNRGNIRDTGKAVCDYGECDYQCVYPETTPGPDHEDVSSYNLYIENFEKHDIKVVRQKILDLFKIGFVWDLDDIVKIIQRDDKNLTNEVIYVTLDNLISNKHQTSDNYGREGFIVNKGRYYIFNAADIDIESSLYSKVLDFSQQKNKYTLKSYLESDPKYAKRNPTPQRKEKAPPIQDTLSEKDVSYNMNIIENIKYKIFGTFRQRGTKDTLFGPRDEKFRIVDRRTIGTKDDDDNRKIVTGMWIGSYKKPQLIDIAKFLKIKAKETLDKEQLSNVIQERLQALNLVLK
jgi:superfamily II DNA or RNA helicase